MRMSGPALSKRILSDKYNAVAFEAASGSDVYLVGGYLRDVLIGRKSRDRDYVARGRFEDILEGVATRTGARAVKIGKRGPYRFFLKDGSSMDFSLLTHDISTDVRERDFTVNSMAWSPTRGLIDLYGGQDDLSAKTLRMISAENILKDPLRILRAYRLAEELSFTIERNTRNVFRLLRGLLKEGKTERITLEFFKVLSATFPSATLSLLWKDGILQCLIGCSDEELGDRLKVISSINQMFKALPLKYRRHLNNISSQNLSFAGLLRLELLLKGRPSHTFCLSDRIQKRLRNLDAADGLLTKESSSKRTLFDVFEKTRESAIDLLLTRRLLAFLPEYERYREIKEGRLLSAEEIKVVLDLRDGPVLGRMVRDIEKARFLGSVRNRADAIARVMKIYQEVI
jgi:tRNA nucleotidyltransferase/poly(A) polymerase